MALHPVNEAHPWLEEAPSLFQRADVSRVLSPVPRDASLPRRNAVHPPLDRALHASTAVPLETESAADRWASALPLEVERRHSMNMAHVTAVLAHVRAE
jgi:hypothetical protein